MTEKTSDKMAKFAATLDDASTPMATLAAAYNFAPDQRIRNFINDQCMQVLAIEIPVLQQVMTQGPAMPATEVRENNLSKMFDDSMERVPENCKPSATVRQAGDDIAALVDQTVNRVLLEDDWANRAAFAAVLSAHAKLIAALDSLALSEDQAKAQAERLEAEKAAAGGVQ